jgi:hypothetical protein
MNKASPAWPWVVFKTLLDDVALLERDPLLEAVMDEKEDTNPVIPAP